MKTKQKLKLMWWLAKNKKYIVPAAIVIAAMIVYVVWIK